MSAKVFCVPRSELEPETSRTANAHCSHSATKALYRVGGVWVQMLEGQGAHDCVILVVRKYIWNAPTVSLFLEALDDIGSLGSPPRQVVYTPGSVVPPWVTISRFLARNREAELKFTTYSSLLLFLVFLSFLFS